MRNCLVTKLKESVNNDNLKKLGVVTVTFLTPQDPENLLRLNCLPNEEMKIKITSDHTISGVAGNCVKVDDKTGIIRNSSSNNGLIIPGSKTNPVTVEIYNFYSMISMLDVAYTETDILDYMSSLTAFNSRRDLSGNTSWFKKAPSLETVEISPSGGVSNALEGSILDFGTLTSLKNLKIGYPGWSTYTKASIEGFVALQRSSGRTSTSEPMSVSFYNNQGFAIATFDGADVNSSTVKSLSWTADTITFDGVTINA